MSVRSSSSVPSGTTRLIGFEYTWTIENIVRVFSSQFSGQPVLHSPNFIAPPDKIVTDDKQPVEFGLSFYPKGINHEDRDFVSLYLDLKNHPGLFIMYSLSIVMANGEKRHLTASIAKFDNGTDDVSEMSWGRDQLIRRDELLNPANGFLSNGNLIIHSKVNIVMSEPGQPDLLDQLQDMYCPPEQLTKSMGDLLDSGLYADVTLVMVNDGGHVLRAHKNILATRSRVFANMFELKMAESDTNRVEIVESQQVFKQALHFIYTGKVGSSLDGIAMDLLICADKYQLDPLKSICEEYLSASISPESDLSNLLALANLHDAPKLMAKVVDSMRKNIEAQLQNVDKVVQMDRFLSSLAPNKEI